MSDDVIGIDLGTTNSAVGVVESGFPILLANTMGERISPSVVAYPRDEEPKVGSVAEGCHPDDTIRSVKRLIGKRLSEVNDFCQPIEADENGGLVIDLGDRKVSPIEVSSEILKSMKEVAEMRLERKVHRAVITVPAYFNDGQRAATKKAGEMAGLTVERIVSEPTAAALAYGLDKLEESSKIAVYDLGGGTFDISVLELREGVFQVLATAGDTELGGDDVDALLVDWVLRELDLGDLADMDSVQRECLLKACQCAKENLSSEESVELKLPLFEGERHLECLLTKVVFEELIEPVLKKTERYCRQVMLDAGLDDVDAAILVGGSTRIPAVRQLVRHVFGKEPDTSQNPDEAVALGAVIQGGILSGAMKNMVLLDVTPLSLGLETFGGLMNVLIPRNTTIPCKAGEMFTNAEANQRGMVLRVLQGEREMAKDNWDLGKFSVAFQPAKKGQARVGVQFSIDENGILEVLARDTSTGKDVIERISSAAVDVTDDQVETMVSESVEHAFEDMAERVFVEAKLKAEELLPAVDMGLAQLQDELDEPSRVEIVSARGAVIEALDGGQANQLKLAVQALDKATENMAALLVEKAMSAVMEAQM